MQRVFGWLGLGGEKVGLVEAGGDGLECSDWEEIGGRVCALSGHCELLNEDGWQRKWT